MAGISTHTDTLVKRAKRFRADLGGNLHDEVTHALYGAADAIAARAISHDGQSRLDWNYRLDLLLTSRWFGFPMMVLILSVVFWLTIAGANVPSAMLANLLFAGEAWIATGFQALGAPWWLEGFLVHGIYRGLAWVIAVMLPPMAIFFPIFTILEDFGYLPRVAFNLDRLFRWAGAHGKQALTMSMGFGCNAAGVIACRVIDSPRERMIAIITNNFVPCNGRWPTIIMLCTVFIAADLPPALVGVAAALIVVGLTLFGILVTLLVAKMLSMTMLKGVASSFQLELPPYRRPKIMRTLYTSMIDRTLFVLWRAILMAAPAGGLIWIMGNVTTGDQSLFAYFTHSLDDFAWFLGLDGVILLAYIIAIPANEIIVPTIIMGYSIMSHAATAASATGFIMTDISSMADLKILFEANGFTMLTAVCFMLFSLLHYPCSTTTYTIWKETRSVKWTVMSNVIPLVVCLLVCALVAAIGRFLF